jgi:ABC-2 type transport system ATP-binding protein
MHGKKVDDLFRNRWSISGRIHILGEIYRFTSRIGIIHEGMLIDEMDIETLNKKMGERLVLGAVNQAQLQSAVKSLGFESRQNSIGEIEINDTQAINEPDSIVSRLVEMNVRLNKVNVEKEDLEQYFLSKVGKQ